MKVNDTDYEKCPSSGSLKKTRGREIWIGILVDIYLLYIYSITDTCQLIQWSSVDQELGPPSKPKHGTHFEELKRCGSDQQKFFSHLVEPKEGTVAQQQSTCFACQSSQVRPIASPDRAGEDPCLKYWRQVTAGQDRLC